MSVLEYLRSHDKSETMPNRYFACTFLLVVTVDLTLIVLQFTRGSAVGEIIPPIKNAEILKVSGAYEPH
jgi:hypothetical protein